MIKICFPPGCYGHYLARCLYHFTELRDGKFVNFGFMPDGSSHAHRKDKSERQKIRVGHFSYKTSGNYHPATIELLPGDTPITILPTPGYWLDYHNNQYIKQSKGDLIANIQDQISTEELRDKLKNNWNYSGEFDTNVPQWIMRELMSFLILPTLQDGYAQDRCEFAQSTKIQAISFFDDFVGHFHQLCNDLSIQIDIPQEQIAKNNQEFIKMQKYHGSQQRCEQWVQDVLSNNTTPSPAQTIYDESYIQHLFREQGYEIQCDGLNLFPLDSNAMRKLIYMV